MKKTIFGALLMLLLLCLTVSVSAENVIRMPYTLITESFSRDGLYTGETFNGIPDGYGVFEAYNIDNVRWHYIGYWMDGLMDGEGATYWDDGSLEVGQYCMGDFIDGYALDQSLALTTRKDETTTDSTETQYIGNKKTREFHYLDCSSINDMKTSNKITLNNRQEAIDMGYSPCGRCKP